MNAIFIGTTSSGQRANGFDGGSAGWDYIPMYDPERGYYEMFAPPPY